MRLRFQKSNQKEKIEISEKQLAKQRRLLEKRLKTKDASVPESAGAFILADELANRPKPKVVDTTALPRERMPGRRKPSLAELRASGEKPKPAPALARRTWKSENYVLPGMDLMDKQDGEGSGARDPSALARVH